MNIPKVIADLQQYKAQLDRAIATLDRLARKRGEKRGRPPKGRPPKGIVEVGKPRTRKFSAATRMRMAAAQRRRWAAQRRAKGSK
jgi:hypothetical protein